MYVQRVIFIASYVSSHQARGSHMYIVEDLGLARSRLLRRVADSAKAQLVNRQAHSAQLDTVSRSGQKVHEDVKNSSSNGYMDRKSNGKRNATADNVQEELLTLPNAFLHFRNGITSMELVVQKADFSLLLMLLALIVIFVLTVCGVTGKSTPIRSPASDTTEANGSSEVPNHPRFENGKQRQRAVDDLIMAGQHVVQNVLQFKEKGGWRQTFNEWRELRKNQVDTNHPLYRALDTHFDEPGIQAQLQSLFTDVSEGELHLTAEQAMLIFSNVHIKVTMVDTGKVLDDPPSTDCVWLTSVLKCSLTSSMFISIFVLYWLIVLQKGIIEHRDDGSTQAEKGEDVNHLEIEYRVEIGSHVAYRATMIYGNVHKLGGSVWLDREVDVKLFARPKSKRHRRPSEKPR